jgi:hypothetical protein
MNSDPNVPLGRDDVLIGKRDSITRCGYCTQGRHNECSGYGCECGKKNHKL